MSMMVSSLANQLVTDCHRNGLASSGFLRSTELLQKYLHSLLSSSLQPYLGRINDPSLREWLRYGIAIHTAGLSKNRIIS